MDDQSKRSGESKCMSPEELSLERTLMSSERTLLSWVRTAMAYVSFGFTIYKILGSISEKLAMRPEVLQPRQLGLFLIIVGTIPLAVAMLQYYKMVIKLGKARKETILSPSFFLASIILLVGVVLSLNIFFRWHLI